jgi:hypothetical protein
MALHRRPVAVLEKPHSVAGGEAILAAPAEGIPSKVPQATTPSHQTGPERHEKSVIRRNSNMPKYKHGSGTIYQREKVGPDGRKRVLKVW